MVSARLLTCYVGKANKSDCCPWTTFHIRSHDAITKQTSTPIILDSDLKNKLWITLPVIILASNGVNAMGNKFPLVKKIFLFILATCSGGSSFKMTWHHFPPVTDHQICAYNEKRLGRLLGATAAVSRRALKRVL